MKINEPNFWSDLTQLGGWVVRGQISSCANDTTFGISSSHVHTFFPFFHFFWLLNLQADPNPRRIPLPRFRCKVLERWYIQGHSAHVDCSWLARQFRNTDNVNNLLRHLAPSWKHKIPYKIALFWIATIIFSVKFSKISLLHSVGVILGRWIQ